MVKEYEKVDLTVYWGNNKGIHSGKCVSNLKSVFNPQKRPWINMQGANSDEIIRVVKNCPSGALSFKMLDEITEKYIQSDEI